MNYAGHPCFPLDHGFIYHASKQRFFQEDLQACDVLQSSLQQESLKEAESKGSKPFLKISAQDDFSDDDDWGPMWPGESKASSAPAQEASSASSSSLPSGQVAGYVAPPPGMPAMLTGFPAGPTVGGNVLEAMDKPEAEDYDAFDDGEVLNSMVSLGRNPHQTPSPELIDLLSIRCQARQWTQWRAGGQAECIVMSYPSHSRFSADKRKVGPKNDISLMFFTAAFARKVLDAEVVCTNFHTHSFSHVKQSKAFLFFYKVRASMPCALKERHTLHKAFTIHSHMCLMKDYLISDVYTSFYW